MLFPRACVKFCENREAAQLSESEPGSSLWVRLPLGGGVGWWSATFGCPGTCVPHSSALLRRSTTPALLHLVHLLRSFRESVRKMLFENFFSCDNGFGNQGPVNTSSVLQLLLSPTSRYIMFENVIFNPVLVVHAYNPGTREAEVQGHLDLLNRFRFSHGHMVRRRPGSHPPPIT